MRKTSSAIMKITSMKTEKTKAVQQFETKTV